MASSHAVTTTATMMTAAAAASIHDQADIGRHAQPRALLPAAAD